MPLAANEFMFTEDAIGLYSGCGILPTDQVPLGLESDMLAFFMMQSLPVETFGLPFPAVESSVLLYPIAEDIYGNFSPSPSPSLRLDSPYTSFHSSPPHTPTAYLPLNLVAPSTAPFLEGTSPNLHPFQSDFDNTTTSNTLPSASAQVSVLPSTGNPRAVSMLKTAKNNNFSRSMCFKNMKKSPSPIANSLLDDSDDEEEATEEEVAPVATRNPASRKSRKSSSNNNATPKKRHILQEWETNVLTRCFEENQFVQASQANELAKQLNMTVNQVRIWYQNKRAFMKRQMSKSSSSD